jgi:dolichyl-phosphate beta-glucosyltransferase
MPPEAEPHLSVIIPAFNEAERIVPTLERLQAYLEGRPHAAEIIVVDDGSLDGTGDAVRACPAPAVVCRVVRNDANRGKGYSVRRGAREARGVYLLVSDADLSTPIEELESLLPYVERDGYAVAMGSRGLPESRIEIRQTWIRERMGKTFNLIIRTITGIPFHDTQCGFKLMRRDRILPVLDECRIDGFCYDVELIYLALRRDLRIAEVPVRWRNSYPSRVRIMRDSFRMLVDAVRIVAMHSGRGSREND